jgi:hypothetical protein
LPASGRTNRCPGKPDAAHWLVQAMKRANRIKVRRIAVPSLAE